MNPLSRYTKIPTVYTKLSTNNIFPYSNAVCEHRPEFGACARSARDELMFNNPDSLMNGEAVVEVIKNNVDGVLDPNNMYVSDVEQLLIAIKLATKEKTYSIETKCPNCEKHGAFERDLQVLLDGVTYLEEIPYVILDESGLLIKFRPQLWKERTKFSNEMFMFHKRAALLEKDESVESEEKMKIFTEIFDGMATLSFEMMLSSIISIETPEFDGQPSEVVDDPEMIKEWLGLQPSFILSVIRDKINEFSNIGISHTLDAQCSECDHVWTIEGLFYDPSDFFAQNFSSRNQKK